MTQIFNRESEKGTRQSLRKSLPAAELILWSKLKNRQICGRRFRRQFSIGRYVVDFYCPALKLAIEVDGDSHYQLGEQERDETAVYRICRDSVSAISQQRDSQES